MGTTIVLNMYMSNWVHLGLTSSLKKNQTRDHFFKFMH